MKRRLFLGLSIAGLLGFHKAKARQLKPVLNVFLAVDLSDDNRKKDRQRDLEAMQAFFSNKGRIAEMDVRIQTFTHERFTIPTLLNAIKSLGNISQNQAPNSGIAVYFSGHGSNRDGSAYPHLDFSDNSLSMNKLSAIVGEQNPKLKFILADCCNNIIENPAAKLAYTANPIDEDLVKGLFWNFGTPNSKQNVLICAAEKGEFSYSLPSGSIFQQMFRRAFDNSTSNDNTKVSWESIKQKTVVEVRKFIDRQSKITGFSYSQSPIFEIDSTANKE